MGKQFFFEEEAHTSHAKCFIIRVKKMFKKRIRLITAFISANKNRAWQFFPRSPCILGKPYREGQSLQPFNAKRFVNVERLRPLIFNVLQETWHPSGEGRRQSGCFEEGCSEVSRIELAEERAPRVCEEKLRKMSPKGDLCMSQCPSTLIL